MGGLLVIAIAVGGGTAYMTRYAGSINALHVDLSQPAAYIASSALSHLPRDLIKAPVVREVLTEDFAFYYEEHEDRLGLRGAIKRIAFEHELTLTDQLLEAALDEPAEVAFWADAKGAPRYWLIAMTRGVLAKALQGLAVVAAKDSQLSVIGEVSLNGSKVTVYALALSPRRTLALAAEGNRVVVLSDPGLLFDDQRQVDPASREVLESLLSGDADAQSIYRHRFGVQAPAPGAHTLIADTRLPSFGYAHFFPGLQALRVDLGAGGSSLHTALRVANRSSLPTPAESAALWAALPMNPALCTLLPLDWAQAKVVLGGGGDDGKPAFASLADSLDGPGAVCWYARSQLHTPLFVGHLKVGAPDPTPALAALSKWLLPKAAVVPTQPAAVPPDAQAWQADVVAPWGTHTQDDKSAYRPTLAHEGRWISYSPDDGLVQLALDAQARRYPSVAQALPANSASLVVVTPKQAAELLQREAFAVLTPQQEVFRQAAQTHLVPRLNALGRLPAARAFASGRADAQGWVPVEWQPVAASAPASR